MSPEGRGECLTGRGSGPPDQVGSPAVGTWKVGQGRVCSLSRRQAPKGVQWPVKPTLGWPGGREACPGAEAEVIPLELAWGECEGSKEGAAGGSLFCRHAKLEMILRSLGEGKWLHALCRSTAQHGQWFPLSMACCLGSFPSPFGLLSVSSILHSVFFLFTKCLLH